MRDYQELHEAQGQAFCVRGEGPHRLVLVAQGSQMTNTDLVGVGAYAYPSAPVSLTVTLAVDGEWVQTDVQLGGNHWNRFGVALEAVTADEVIVELAWHGDVDVSLWGLAAGPLELPDALVDDVPVSELNKTHLAPETFYLVQDVALGLDLDEEESTIFTEVPGETVTLKKCSYCQRMLPVDSDRLGTLAFHKHNAKPTKHQNECRACKKWRINDSFNPLRTTDQLHESSLITRERRLFLRDPERLQQYKKREGAGLKSQIWERFGRQCFYCGKRLELTEVQLDHTRPLAYLWPIDEFATCLCAVHNNQKTDKFPVDFYNDHQLRELSQITGLPYTELTAKAVNQDELERIRLDIVTFAREWEPRTFAATARKVRELMPHVDLFEELKAADEYVHAELVDALAKRPLGVQGL